MSKINPSEFQQIIHHVIPSNGNFPNNSLYPLLIYKQVFNINQSLRNTQEFLEKNAWIKSWINSVYDYHHYHSNTHEVLVIISGTCTIEFGGENGKKFDVSAGDVIIIPAGVSHKNIGSSPDFKCVGAYPFDVDYDMNYGKPEEYEQAEKKIKSIGLPAMDPIFGEKGPLFRYWK